MKTFKGTDKDMKCRGFQFEPGVEYEMDGRINVCDRGFHGCERPLDVINYYPPATSRYFEVEQDGILDRGSDDSKVASSRIKLGAEIDIPGLVKAQVEYVKAHTTTEHTDPKQATAGYRGAATAGYSGAATAGDFGAATSRGAADVGRNGIACVRGQKVKVKGGLGALLIIGVENDDGNIKYHRTVVVDGEKVKPDTWYTLDGRKLVEDEPDQ